MKNNIIEIYIDFKSPYAYLAIDSSIKFAKHNKLEINWLPFVLEIPDFLGSAKVDDQRNIIESNRNPHQWRRVKYSYMDCRRYANIRDITIRGPQKIWDTQLISIALLWTKNNHYELTELFIKYVFEKFWKRELDIEDNNVITNVLKHIGISTNGFKEWSINGGKKELEVIIEKGHEKGVFGVPSYYFDNELFWGREHLPMIEAIITNDYSKIY
jgi:2-hydroxychromene-2-carboxylate isomerase|tara:strand:- start:515 stop:1156 length:642 start_codon:yes stop_codon:yes gene_type:complete